MKNIFKNIIDYSVVNEFEIDVLIEALVLPFKKEGIYIYCFTCEESDIKSLQSNLIIKEKKLSKNNILFFLDDIGIRKKLFVLSKLCLKSDEHDSKSIEEFIYILLNQAVDKRCSDIHIECLEDALALRFRIDGILKLFYLFEKSFSKVISSYLKMVSKLDITEYRIPLDAAFTFDLKKEKYDFRISTMPTIYGESIVLRVLDSKKVKKDLKSLGFTQNIYKKIEQITKINQGLVLISGPTGSGKSTTLYSFIETLNNENKKIITIEDPVEYKIEQIQQVNIHEAIGLSFDKVLKNILRQDPDIILIGEIRDTYSLQVALQASLTGHLVLASIHANNSIETLFRLIDLDADRYLLASTLKSIISQRLVLSLCIDCKGKGCRKCNFTGYYGRTCIAEVLKIDNNISSQILNNNIFNDLNDYLQTLNFETMLDNGNKKIELNQTTLDEVLKVL